MASLRAQRSVDWQPIPGRSSRANMSKTGERQMRRTDEDALLRSVSEQLLAGVGGDIGVTVKPDRNPGMLELHGGDPNQISNQP